MKRWKDQAIYIPPRTCWYQKGKFCYDKRGAISAKNLRFKKDKIQLRAYWCPHCNFWHLTKQLIDKFMSDETPSEVTITDLPSDEKPAEETKE